MKKLLLMLCLFAPVGVVSANPVIGEVFMHAVAIFAPAFMGANSEPSKCWSEPVRKVEWKANPGYTFDVAGCDYEANKSKYNLIK